MILRTWTARASETGAENYRNYFETVLLPQLQDLDGFCGALLLSRETKGAIELTAHTIWQSEQHIRAFAGDDIAAAKVEPEALSMLEDSDPVVTHRTVLIPALPWTAERGLRD